MDSLGDLRWLDWKDIGVLIETREGVIAERINACAAVGGAVPAKDQQIACFYQ